LRPIALRLVARQKSYHAALLGTRATKEAREDLPPIELRNRLLSIDELKKAELV
jgi:hypothetical protein